MLDGHQAQPILAVLLLIRCALSQTVPARSQGGRPTVRHLRRHCPSSKSQTWLTDSAISVSSRIPLWKSQQHLIHQHIRPSHHKQRPSSLSNNAPFLPSFDQSTLTPPPPVFTPDILSPPALMTIVPRASTFSDIANVFADEATRASYGSAGLMLLCPPVFMSAPLHPVSHRSSDMQAGGGQLGHQTTSGAVQHPLESMVSSYGMEVCGGQLGPQVSHGRPRNAVGNGGARFDSARPRIPAAVGSGPVWRQTMRPPADGEDVPRTSLGMQRGIQER